MNNLPPVPALYLKMWGLYPLLVPFYLLGKTPTPRTARLMGGVPQIADYYFVFVMVCVVTGAPFYLLKRALLPIRILTCFLCYVALVNLTWTAVLENITPVTNTLFYLYDGMLFLMCVILYSLYQDAFLKTTLYSVMASVVLQAILSPIGPHESLYRHAGFFNDENQLGYFSLLAAVIAVPGLRRFQVSIPYQLLFWFCDGYLATISQCRAALAALAVLAILAVLDKPLRALVVAALLLSVYSILSFAPDLVGKSGERFVIGGEYDTLSTRGYDKLLDFSEYLLLGAGEGAYDRFPSDLYATEIHSSYGTFLFCYGIIGAGLFSCCLLALCRYDFTIAFWLVPILVYGSAHHGLRFAFCWTTLGFLCCLGLEPPRNNQLRIINCKKLSELRCVPSHFIL